MVSPGVLPLSIIRGIAFEQHVLQCKDETVTVSGTLSPNVIGQYVPSGDYNGFDLFILEGSPSTFLYVNPVAASYVIARILTNAALTDYWAPAVPILTEPSGTYLANGAVTGTATVADHPVNLTGFTPSAQGRRSPGAEEIVVDFAPTITDAVNGEITIPAMTHNQTRSLLYTGAFAWDLVLIDISGNRDLVAIKGPLTISDNVTQAD